MSRRGIHNWDTILRDISSGEDSDAEDSLNVLSVQKNARRVCELIREMAPPGVLDEPQGLREVVPPRGMNLEGYRTMQEGIRVSAEKTSVPPVSTSVSEAAASASSTPASSSPLPQEETTTEVLPSEPEKTA